MIRFATRVLLILLAAAVVAAAVYFSVRAVPGFSGETLRQGFIQAYRPRLRAPRPGAIGEFAKEMAALGAVALIGRAVFRLRL